MILWALVFSAKLSNAAVPPPSLSDQLVSIRSQIAKLEQSFLEEGHDEEDVKNQVRRIQKLLRLQKLEKTLGERRQKELESTVKELEIRRSTLNTKLVAHRKKIRALLIAIEASNRIQIGEKIGQKIKEIHLPQQEMIEAPRRKVMANLVDRGLKEIEILHADIADAAQLEGHIQTEKEQLAYLFQDLKEQASILELNRQLQLDVLKRKQDDHLVQLKNYRSLKTAEARVENLIGQFNARLELERAQETAKEIEGKVSALADMSEFSKAKGKLPFPVASGRVTTPFGRAFDPNSGLYIFKKGIDIVTDQKQVVKAVFDGKIAYAGDLPNYGSVVIVDHGNHFYSLCGHLGKVSRKVNEKVKKGESIGLTGDSSTPLYFEIRSRNVAVNPLQWLFN